jgi:predicted dehydrogenase
VSHSKIKVGIAGYGVVGKRRAECVKKNKHMNLVAVCDRNFKTVDKFDDGIYCYPKYNDLLDHGIDVLIVCLTNDVAAEVTIAGLNSGMHVFCEKPPGQNLKQVAEVIKTQNKDPYLKLKYGFNHRYHQSVKDAYKIINSGELGKVVDLNAVYGKSKVVTATGPNADWRSRRNIAGGGILLDQGIHMVDLVRYFAGDFEEVLSFISNNYWKYDVEDNAYALMRSSSGIVTILQSSATQWRHDFRLHITLEKGSIILKGILTGTKSYGAETLTVAYKADDESGDPKEKIMRYNYDPSWEDEINEFAEAIVNDSPIVSGTSYDAYKTMELVYRIYCADPIWKNKYKLTSD